MQKLTKEKAQELLKGLQYSKARCAGLSIREEYYKQALEKLIEIWDENEGDSSEKANR